MLPAIESFHKPRLVQWNLKTTKFLVRSAPKFSIVWIDYHISISEEEINNQGKYESNFVGCVYYVSIQARAGKPQGRRDHSFF